MAGDWQPVETMPLGRKVHILTITGLERVARRSKGYHVEAHKWAGKSSLHCWRADGHNGDLVAVGWKEIET